MMLIHTLITATYWYRPIRRSTCPRPATTWSASSRSGWPHRPAAMPHPVSTPPPCTVGWSTTYATTTLTTAPPSPTCAAGDRPPAARRPVRRRWLGRRHRPDGGPRPRTRRGHRGRDPGGHPARAAGHRRHQPARRPATARRPRAVLGERPRGAARPGAGRRPARPVP